MRAASFLGLGVLMAGGLAAAIVLARPPIRLLDWLAARYPGCLYRVPVDARMVALTLDDGPDPTTTPLILAELERHHARATFFLITDRVKGQEGLVQRLLAAGHELGNHFRRDRPSIGMSPEEFERDLDEAHRVLAQFGSVRWARPASGWYSQSMIRTMERHGYRCALGSVYPYDATIPSVAFSRRHLLRNVRPGAVLVLHDGGSRGQRTARVLRAVLPELARRGFRVVALSELVDAAQHAPAERSSDEPARTARK